MIREAILAAIPKQWGSQSNCSGDYYFGIALLWFICDIMKMYRLIKRIKAFLSYHINKYI